MSLTEILVVLVIIVVLAGILFPLTRSMRERAGEATDINRIRGIAGAALGYAAENNGRLPNVGIPMDGTDIGQGNRWHFGEAIERYLGEREYFASRSIYNWKHNEIWYAENTRAHQGWTPNPGYPTVKKAAGFGRNVHIAPSTPGLSNPWMGYLSRVPDPGRIVMIAEILNDSLVAIPDQPATTRNDVESRYRVSRRGRAMYAFTDGRVAMLEGDQSEPALKAAGKPSIWRWW